MPTDAPTLDEIETIEALEIERARADCNAFTEWVLKDKHGQRVKQGEIHRLIQRFLDWTMAHGRHALVLAPWGHGKTEAAAIARVLHVLGRNPDLRGKVVSNTDDAARQRVVSIRRYIERDEDLRRVFPGLLMGDEERSKGKLTVERRGKGKDPSLEAFGILSSSIGTRADFMIFDDVVDLRNAIAQPVLRETVKQAFQEGFMSRLEPDGWVCYIATPWHNLDLTMDLVGKARRGIGDFSAMVLAVAEDLAEITVEVAHAPGFEAPDRIPLWGGRTRQWLLRERESRGARAFARGFHQRPFSDEDAIFREHWFRPQGASRFSLPDAQRDPELYSCSIGVDPAISKKSRADYFALAVVGVPHGENGKMRLLELFRRRGLSVQAQADAIIDFWMHWRPNVVRIETIAYQDALRQVIEERAAERKLFLRIEPVPHQAQRKEERFGMWSAFVESGKLEIDADRFPEVVHEAITFPADHDDALDAIDLAVRGAIVPTAAVQDSGEEKTSEADSTRWGFGGAAARGRAAKFGFGLGKGARR